MHCLALDGYCKIEPVRSCPRKYRTESFSWVCSRLFHKLFPLFRWNMVIRVASMSSGDFRSFLSSVLMFMWECKFFYSINLSFQFVSSGVVVSIFFNQSASLQVKSILSRFVRSFSHFIPEFISSVPSCLSFSPTSHPFLLWFNLHPEFSFFLPLYFLFSRIRWFIVKFIRSFGFIFIHSVIFSCEFNLIIRVDCILFILVIFPMLEILISLLIVISLYSIRSAKVFSEVLVSNPFNYF